jgi:hypothetical protein
VRVGVGRRAQRALADVLANPGPGHAGEVELANRRQAPTRARGLQSRRG